VHLSPNKTAAFHNQPSPLRRVAAFCFTRLRFFEIALVLVRFDHDAYFIANANHSAM
jgi:hypothetical protein